MSDLAQLADVLRAAHRPGNPLVLVDVWDGWSARTVAATPGCEALATTSWAIAESRGYADGEQIPVEELLAAVSVIAAATDLPVTADLGSGHGDVRSTAAAAVAVGAVGVDLADRAAGIDEHVARVMAARAAGDDAGVGLVVTARSDEYVRG